MYAQTTLFAYKYVAFATGCFMCWLLQHQFGFSAVLASASVGFVGSLYPFDRKVNRTGIHAAIYSGSFAGMCSLQNLPTIEHILCLSMIGTGVYLIMKPRFVGFGGKLGVIALISSLLLIYGGKIW